MVNAAASKVGGTKTTRALFENPYPSSFGNINFNALLRLCGSRVEVSRIRTSEEPSTLQERRNLDQLVSPISPNFDSRGHSHSFTESGAGTSFVGIALFLRCISHRQRRISVPWPRPCPFEDYRPLGSRRPYGPICFIVPRTLIARMPIEASAYAVHLERKERILRTVTGALPDGVGRC